MPSAYAPASGTLSEELWQRVVEQIAGPCSIVLENVRQRLVKPCRNQRTRPFAKCRAARSCCRGLGKQRIVELGQRIFGQSQAFGQSLTEIRERTADPLVGAAVEQAQRNIGKQVRVPHQRSKALIVRSDAVKHQLGARHLPLESGYDKIAFAVSSRRDASDDRRQALARVGQESGGG